MEKLILMVKNLKKIYNNKIILDIDYLGFQESKIYAIVGPNGSGKTTLLNILNLLAKSEEGQIFFRDQEIIINSNSKILEIRRKMTLVDQDPFLFQSTVYGNVAYGLKVRSLSSIDQKHIDKVEKIITKIRRELKTTVIFTTHDLSQAYRLADEVISLLDGKIIQQIPENLLRGEIVEEEDGSKRFKTMGNIKFAIVSEKIGPAYISIDPRDIILSYEPFQSSARNSFLGKTTKIIEQNHLVKLEIDIGIPLVVIITRESFFKMIFNLGSKVYLTFKASAVRLY